MHNAFTAMEDAQKSAIEYGAARDRYDSYRAQQMRKKDMFAQQYQKAVEQEKLLNILLPEELKDEVEVGSVILLENQNIYVSIGLGRFQFEGQTWVAISARVPIFQSLKGLHKGDVLNFRGKQQQVLDVF